MNTLERFIEIISEKNAFCEIEFCMHTELGQPRLAERPFDRKLIYPKKDSTKHKYNIFTKNNI
jgi:hypothetical protein